VGELSPEVEQALADMSEGDWAALVAKTRAPDSREQLREVARKFVPPHAAADPDGWLSALVDSADLSKFTDDSGNFSEAVAAQHLGRLFPNAGAPPQTNWGQRGGDVPHGGPGSAGSAEAKRRLEAGKFVAGGAETPPAPNNGRQGFGSGGAAEAARRQAAKGDN
jgi:hypothetical protein